MSEIERLLREFALTEDDPQAAAERSALEYQRHEAEYQRRLAASNLPTRRHRFRLGAVARAIWHRLHPTR